MKLYIWNKHSKILIDDKFEINKINSKYRKKTNLQVQLVSYKLFEINILIKLPIIIIFFLICSIALSEDDWLYIFLEILNLLMNKQNVVRSARYFHFNQTKLHIY